MKVYFVAVFSIVFTLLSVGQTNQVLGVFSVQQISNSIKISWIVRSGYSCTDVNVEHSLDSSNFISIYTYPGVCGSVSKDEEYYFIQQDPAMNTKNYYRINLGNYGYSEVLQITFFNYGNTGCNVVPNPIGNAGMIKFNNPGNTKFNLEVSDSMGIRAYSQEIFTDKIELSSLIFSSGLYFFRLYNANENFVGRFVAR